MKRYEQHTAVVLSCATINVLRIFKIKKVRIPLRRFIVSEKFLNVITISIKKFQMTKVVTGQPYPWSLFSFIFIHSQTKIYILKNGTSQKIIFLSQSLISFILAT